MAVHDEAPPTPPFGVATPAEKVAIEEAVFNMLENDELDEAGAIAFDNRIQIKQEQGGLYVQAWIWIPNMYLGDEPDGIKFETPPSEHEWSAQSEKPLDTPSLDTSFHDHEMDVDDKCKHVWVVEDRMDGREGRSYCEICGADGDA